MFVYMFNTCSRVAQSFCIVQTNFATFYASGIKGEVRGASETLCIFNLKKIRQAKKAKFPSKVQKNPGQLPTRNFLTARVVAVVVS